MLITKEFTFDAAHRVLGHQGKCRYLHGHTYTVLVSVFANELDGLGFVMDFGEMKSLFGGWIDEHFDHNILLNSDDPLLADSIGDGVEIFAGRPPFLFAEENPTAENIAKRLHRVFSGLIADRDNIVVDSVRVYESPGSYAEYYPE